MSETYKTGYESRIDNGVIDLEGSIEKINDELKRRSSEKYESFLKGLKGLGKAFKIMKLKDRKKRHQLLVLVYYRMRLEDDIRDNDTPHKLDIETKEKILEKHTSGKFFPNSLPKAFSKEVYKLAKELGIEDVIKEGIGEIRKSIMRDEKRVLQYEKNILQQKQEIKEGKRKKINKSQALVRKTRKELQENFHRLDIIGTVLPTMKLFNVSINDKKGVNILSNLGDICRRVYTIDDLLTEPKLGILNIPIEDIKEFNISDEDINALANTGKDKITKLEDLPESIKLRAISEKKKIHEDFKKYKKEVKKHTFIFENTGWGQNKINNVVSKNGILKKAYEKRIIQVIEKFDNVEKSLNKSKS